MADLRAPEAETDSTEAGRDVSPPGRTPSTGERVPQPRLAIAEVPAWVTRRIDQVAYPTRMARRRALEAARTVDGWQPDVTITSPLLDQVAARLVQMADVATQPTPGVLSASDVGSGPDHAPDGRLLTKSERRAARRNTPRTDRTGRHAADVVPAQVPPSPKRRPVRPTRSTGRGRLSRHQMAPTTKPPAGLLDTLPAHVGHRRLPRRLVAGIVVASVAVCGAAFAVLSREGARQGARTQAAVAAAPQQVLAVTFARQGQVTGMSLLASGSAEPQQILVPSRLLLDVPGAGRIPVGQSLGPGSSAPGAALGDALEIRVAGTWVLSTAALARLVDDVGGVQVDVDVDVTQGAAVGAPILVAAGRAQRLTGALAAEYAQFIVDEEPEVARLARQDKVLTAVLAQLPIDAERRRDLLSALPGAQTGAALDVAVAVTGALHAAAADRSLASVVLPVRDIDAGGSVTAYGLDSAATATLVRARLAGAALPTPASGRLRVLVQNGVGTPGLGEAARVRLVSAGLMYVGGGNVEGFGVAESVVLLPDGTSTSRARGAAVANALGLAESALRISDNTSGVVDVVVVLGKDFSAS